MGIQKALNKALECVVTCVYVGHLPFAPGTYASALACIAVYLVPSLFGDVFFVTGLVLFSVVCVGFFEYEGTDPGYIVIDEVAGMCVTMAAHRITLVNTIAGFLLFRFFDILKPFPIRQAERLKGAFGVVADDVVAGLFASIILVILGRVL